MQIRVMHPSELEPRHLDAWRGLQSDHPSLDRPFFSPEYTQILGEVRPEVEVAVLERGGEPVGFFPFQRVSPLVGRAPGLRLCDFQGLVAPPDLEIDPIVLMRACGLQAWHFDHVLEEQATWRDWHVTRSGSPLVDLTKGYDAYLAERRAAEANWVSQVPRKARKMAREVGELRFVYDCRDQDVLSQVLSWKSLQRERTMTDDMLQHDWVRQALDAMLRANGPTFSCVLSALFAGPHLVAGHLGLRSGRALHLWFPAFDLAYERYSPGLVMLTEMFRLAADAGIEWVDLGKGDDRYKQSLASATVLVTEGSVDTRRLRRLVGRAWYAGRARYRGSRLAVLLTGPKRRLRRLVKRVAATG
ncbi:MAG TPA: GNAT family N-acetyltransferase [Vicinamibacterales bacterium]|nr:GNAT family N-acetyltransferase [Acidobacteriota bacterium]HOC17643.1 GNAT family N-acetyltransferase [Vicinamibacterales bacterium]